jgi:magnesium transporter
VQPEERAKDILQKIVKETAEFSVLNNIYVTNTQNELIGVFNLHELILQDPITPVYRFMIQNVVVLHVTTPIEIAFNKMEKYKLASIPVINKNKNIIGVVAISDIIPFILEKR